MRILTDDPGAAAAFLSADPDPEWRVGPLAAAERALARALPLEAVFTAQARGPSPFWATLIVVRDAAGSQFAALDHLLRTGYRPKGPLAAVALAGRHFRGQRERQWVGARGNLQLSVAIPTDMSMSDAGAGLSMLPAVAAVDAIASSTRGAVRPGIKWVNDLVIGNRKIGGVLTAAHVTGRRVDDVLWGIGLNVAVLPQVEPTPFVPAATCLHAVAGGQAVSVPALCWALLNAIETRFTGLLDAGAPSLIGPYRDASLVVGRSVTVWDEAECRDTDPSRWGPPLAEGVVTGIREDLALTLDGGRQVVDRGRLAMQAHD
jgi:BirA family biotin operon repressor/biotin-[acetyl-CoA-carboxylase] ligase